MKIGEKIALCRKSAGLSQEDLASRLHISRQAVSRWETGEAVPDTDKVILLSRLFAVSTDYLLIENINTGNGNVEQPKSAVLERRRKFRIVFGISLLISGILSVLAALILSGLWAAYTTHWVTALGPFRTALFKTWRIMPLILGTVLTITGGTVLWIEYRRED